MSGDFQHHLPAALIGGFGVVRPGKPLRKATIMVKELRTDVVHPSTAENEAARRALYRLPAPPPGTDPDVVDGLWTNVERGLPGLVRRLADRSLVGGDADLLIGHAAMAGVRHPTFQDVADDWQARHGRSAPVGDQVQWMRVEGLLNHLKVMPSWRWRVLHSPDDAPRLMLSDRGWIYVREPDHPSLAIFLPMGPRVGLLGYLDAANLPPRQPPFEEHRVLVPSWVEWLNAAAGSDAKFTNALFAHPDDQEKLRRLPDAADIRVNALGPFRGVGMLAETLFH